MSKVTIPYDQLKRVCRNYRIRELALFGSVTRDDFGPASDVDVLVDFEPDARAGFVTMGRLIEDLSAIFGRKVDVVTKRGLSPYLRDRVLSERETVYVQA